MFVKPWLSAYRSGPAMGIQMKIPRATRKVAVRAVLMKGAHLWIWLMKGLYLCSLATRKPAPLLMRRVEGQQNGWSKHCGDLSAHVLVRFHSEFSFAYVWHSGACWRPSRIASYGLSSMSLDPKRRNDGSSQDGPLPCFELGFNCYTARSLVQMVKHHDFALATLLISPCQEHPESRMLSFGYSAKPLLVFGRTPCLQGGVGPLDGHWKASPFAMQASIPRAGFADCFWSWGILWWNLIHCILYGVRLNLWGLPVSCYQPPQLPLEESQPHLHWKQRVWQTSWSTYTGLQQSPCQPRYLLWHDMFWIRLQLKLNTMVFNSGDT